MGEMRKVSLLFTRHTDQGHYILLLIAGKDKGMQTNLMM
jgi:hypothetical protein